MYGNGIAGERVESQQVELSWRFTFEREPGIARHDGVGRRAILEESELGGSDLHYGRIDLVEVVVIDWARVGGQRASAQADYGGADRSLLREGLERAADARSAGIVSGRVAPVLGPEELLPMVEP